MVFRKKPTIKSKGKRLYKRAAPKKPVSKAIKAYVKRSISSNIENKFHVDYALNQSIVSAAGGTIFSHRPLLPSIPQGLGSGQRIGNDVNVKSAIIRGSVNLLPYNVSSNPNPIPCYVMIWLVKSKLRNLTFNTSNVANDFYDLGSYASGPQGHILDTMFPVNKQSWICYYKRKIKLGTAGHNSSGNSVTSGYSDNSPFSVPFYINYSKHLKKMKYDDASVGSPTTPTNTNLTLVFQCVSCDGLSSGQFALAEFHMTNTISYEDA